MGVSVAQKHYFGTVGEGPHWDVKSSSLICVDINAGDISQWNTVTDEKYKLHLDGTVGFAVPRSQGGLVTGLNRSIVTVDWDGSNLVNHGEVEHGTRNRFNDGKCDANGRLWAGTMGHEESPGVLPPEAGALYSLKAGGNLQHKLTKISISNGLAWSLDNTVMYYIDSIPGKVYAFDYDINTGTISNQRTALDIKGMQEDLGIPDGMCSDADGKLWVAMFFGSKVVRFDPETGKEIQRVALPAPRITSCCFGGMQLEDLYVTSAKSEEPLSGSLFKVTGLGVKGLPMNNFAG